MMKIKVRIMVRGMWWICKRKRNDKKRLKNTRNVVPTTIESIQLYAYVLASNFTGDEDDSKQLLCMKEEIN